MTRIGTALAAALLCAGGAARAQTVTGDQPPAPAAVESAASNQGQADAAAGDATFTSEAAGEVTGTPEGDTAPAEDGQATPPDGEADTNDADGIGAASAGGGASEVTAPAPEKGFNLKLRAIEERVNALKEKIFQSKARLIQLQEVVLHGAITGAKAVLVHRNEMGSSFRLKRVQYALDQAPVFNRVDTGSGELNDQEEIEIFNGSIAPGNHQISVYLEYQGHGYGFFSYLKGYRFKIKSSFTFNAEEGKVTTVRIVGFEKGGVTAELKDRPSVRYDVESTQALRKDNAGEEAAPAATED